ncbi:MAG: carboxypeptidase-like regulatory domain-containing protein, partial [Alphaproteobacteria bacterium]|nr:carboxypeptidase-like regulatory domain-containing protein [Alphaproteobacteria bacterium]
MKQVFGIFVIISGLMFIAPGTYAKTCTTASFDVQTVSDKFCNRDAGIGGDLGGNEISFHCSEYKPGVSIDDIKNYFNSECSDNNYDIKFYSGAGTSAETLSEIEIQVVDEQNAPVIGANIISPNKELRGVSTDIDGKATFTGNFDTNDIISVSYVGFETQLLPARANMGTITLKEASNNIHEVVVTAQAEKCNKGQLKEVHATEGRYLKGPKKCVPQKCEEPYKLNRKDESDMDAKCEPKTGTCPTSSVDIHAKSARWKIVDGENICKITECNPGWSHNEEKNRCEEIKECPAGQVPPHAKESKMENGKCIVESCECGYQVKDNKCVEITNKTCTNDTKPKLPKNAQSATMECDASGKTYCKIDKCNDNFTLENNKCEKQDGTECTHDDPNATKAKNEVIAGELTCVVKKCADGYMVDDVNNKCEKSDGPCSPEQLAKIENATKGEMKKGKCKATECKDGFEPSKGECKAKKEKKDKDKKDDDDGLSDEEKKKRQAELDANAKAMKEKEQSTANKMLGAVGMGATGIGAMQMMSGAAEQKADEDAEADMKAYLETFTCKFGDTR